MHRAFQRTDAEREQDRAHLNATYAGLLARSLKLRLSTDQPYRISDVAVDFCEDVERLDDATIADVVRTFEAAGATAKVSSIHVNAWIGDFSKLEMSLRLLQDVFSVTASEAIDRVLYVGDSPNDEPMFAHFRHTVGVANLSPFLGHLRIRPAWMTAQAGGLGFAELASRLLKI
jgi:hydroxymethylpyrimidine pyrophosphatase-like HAD family hydrolase